jgi:hypothetical protein
MSSILTLGQVSTLPFFREVPSRKSLRISLLKALVRNRQVGAALLYFRLVFRYIPKSPPFIASVIPLGDPPRTLALTQHPAREVRRLRRRLNSTQHHRTPTQHLACWRTPRASTRPGKQPSVPPAIFRPSGNVSSYIYSREFTIFGLWKAIGRSDMLPSRPISTGWAATPARHVLPGVGSNSSWRWHASAFSTMVPYAFLQV